MQTTLSTKGQVILPAELRKKGRFSPGDKFNVREKIGAIILKPAKKKRNYGLLKLLQSCPGELKLPSRDQSPNRPPPKF